jgi:hypothetical protein
MKPRFFLLDHSIEDSSGHYLEYARRVLRAAKNEGLETVLAVNKRAENIGCPEADTLVRAFSNTFWENQALSRARRALEFIWKTGRRNSGQCPHARRYSADLQEFFQGLDATDKDIIFVPTLGVTELNGIALWSGRSDARDLQWHLLFRRDLPRSDSGIDAKCRAFAKVREGFKNAIGSFNRGKQFFYTDSDRLTDCYGRLGTWKFRTLPIPIDETLGIKKRKQAGPYVVSYLGDAREEKGFHLLPGIVSDLRSAGWDEKRVIFRIQANFPLTGKTPAATRAKNELFGLRDDGVELLEGPFDSCAYQQMISSSDLILIPYCPTSYAARSSGVFAEALAAGVPTIYPAATWMARYGTGSGSLDFERPADLPGLTARILSNYAAFESRSIAYSQDWRNEHSAKKLVRCLVDTEMRPGAAAELLKSND